MLSIKKKVLIIPSWYPTLANPLVGSFFKEQAELVQDEFDISILYGKRELLSKKRFFFNKLSFNLLQSKQGPNLKANSIVTPPQGVYFNFKHVLNLEEEANFGFMLNSYENEFNKLLKKEWKPDLIHAQSTVYGGIIAQYLGEKYNIPVIITEHQVFLLHRYSKFLQNKVWRALEAANEVLAVSNYQKRCILMHEISCNPYVIGNYINESLFPLKATTTNSHFKILTITYPGLIKDAETFFKAIAHLVRRGHDNIIVTVIGNNSFDNIANANVNEFTRLAEKYEISRYCNLVSHVEREKLSEYYQDHDVFVSTSVAETFGVAICEALASGIPVVSTKSGGVDDTIGENNGIKVNIKDYKAVAEALIKIKTKELKYNPEILRQSVVEEYGKEAFTQKLVRVYNQAISNYQSK